MGGDWTPLPFSCTKPTLAKYPAHPRRSASDRVIVCGGHSPPWPGVLVDVCVYLVAALGITLLERWVLGVAVVAVLVAVTRRVSSGLAVPLTPAAIADTELEALDCLPFAWGDPRKMRPKKNDGGKKN